MAANVSSTSTSNNLEVFARLKELIISNAKLQHGASKTGHPRTYDIVTSSKAGSRGEYRVCLVVYDELVKPQGKVEIESKILSRSTVKMSTNQAMEDLLKKSQEALWT